MEKSYLSTLEIKIYCTYFLRLDDFNFSYNKFIVLRQRFENSFRIL